MTPRERLYAAADQCTANHGRNTMICVICALKVVEESVAAAAMGTDIPVDGPGSHRADLAEMRALSRDLEIERSKRETAERRAWQSRERMEVAERERDAALADLQKERADKADREEHVRELRQACDEKQEAIEQQAHDLNCLRADLTAARVSEKAMGERVRQLEEALEKAARIAADVHGCIGEYAAADCEAYHEVMALAPPAEAQPMSKSMAKRIAIMKEAKEEAQPQATATSYINQCDGCRAGRPVDANGNHRMGDGEYGDLMHCQREKYEQPQATATPAIERVACLGCNHAAHTSLCPDRRCGCTMKYVGPTSSPSGVSSSSRSEEEATDTADAIRNMEIALRFFGRGHLGRARGDRDCEFCMLSAAMDAAKAG